MNDSIEIETTPVLFSSPIARSLRGSLAPWLLVAVAAGCGGGGGGGGSLDTVAPGQSALKPGATGPFNGGAYIVDPSEGGAAQELQLLEMSWGRLVDVFDTGPNNERRLVFTDFVIGEDVRDRTEGGVLVWDFETNPVTGESSLQINVDIQQDPELFEFRIAEASVGLKSVAPKGIAATELPPFPLVARNSALVLRFNDLIDESTIDLNETVTVLTGADAVLPFDARVVPDVNRGGVSAVDGAFHTSRVIVDFTISQSDLLAIPEVVQVNGVGLPASEDSFNPNVLLRLPTRTAAGATQNKILTTVGGNGLEPDLNEPLDFQSETLDVVRAMRSGNASDPNNGFLLDLDPPRLLGVQPIVVVQAQDVPATADPRDISITFEYQVDVCALTPQVEDVLQVTLPQVGTLSLNVDVPGNVNGTLATNVVFRVPLDSPLPEPGDLIGLAGQFQTSWRDTLPVIQAPCFVRFTPAAQALPVADVSPDASVVLRFSEPLDPATVRPFDTLYVAKSALTDAQQIEGPTAPGPSDLVVGEIVPSPDFTEFRFTPLVPFDHDEGSFESFFLNLVSGLNTGIVDLAGNGLEAVLPRVEFRLDPGEATRDTGGWVLRFNTPDEDGIEGPDVAGQFLFDSINGRLLPRPVQRFSSVLDRSQPTVGVMQPITTGLQTPLASAGSKAHLTWRYVDVGFIVSQTDGTFYDLDVEGLALSPLGGQVSATFYEEFEIQLAHGDALPDESINPNNLNPNFPNSGFKGNQPFTDNFLPDSNDGPKLVHPRELGYAVSNTDVFISATNSPMLPMPWNRGLDEDEKIFFTWRNTAITTLGATSAAGELIGPGVPGEQEVATLGLPIAPGGTYGNDGIGSTGVGFPAGIPTVGLPLITEFRCYPTEAPSLNNFDVSIAVTSSNRPFFRAFSTGGLNSSGQIVEKDPDLEVNPSGGFNGNPQIAPLGQSTIPRDPTVYMGQLDIVVRLSRVHTVVVDSEQNYSQITPLGALYDYVEPLLLPAAADQPTGTSIVLAYRGDDRQQFDISPDTGDESDIVNGDLLDVYGNVAYGELAGDSPENVDARVFAFSNPDWVDSIDGVDGLRFLQTRLTFVSNTASQSVATLDSYAVAYTR